MSETPPVAPETPAVTPTPQQRINDLRERVLKGEQITPEEYRDVIQSYRTRRLEASDAAAAKAAPKIAKRAAAKPNQSLDDLLGDLGI